MKPHRRGIAVAAAGVAMAVAAATVGCGAGGVGDADGFTIGLLLPTTQNPRYEFSDRPMMERRIKELCEDCTLVYDNAELNAATQHQQVTSMITRGVEVLVLDPVDAASLRSSVNRAHGAGIPVVAYDRLAQGPIAGYVSFDNEQVGELQGEALLKALGKKAGRSQIVMLNGSPTDPNAADYKKGALSVLRGKVEIGKTYDAPGWGSEEAYTSMAGAISALGADSIDGVYAANDNLASGAASALKAAKVEPLPPITGQDASIEAVQRIVRGEQYMTVYKPFKPEADAAAEMAVALGRGESLDDVAETNVDSPTTENIPAVLLTPVPVTVNNIESTLVRDGMYTIEEICPPKNRSACDKAGLTG